jgi:hypothetical protein
MKPSKRIDCLLNLPYEKQECCSTETFDGSELHWGHLEENFEKLHPLKHVIRNFSVGKCNGGSV